MLRPEGHGNPLGTIYAALSDQLHQGTDEECLELAQNLRTALEFLIRTLTGFATSTDQYVQAVDRLQAATGKKPPKSSQ
jgi:hypothetical protein